LSFCFAYLGIFDYPPEMGLPVSDEPTPSVVIDIQNADIEGEELPDPQTDPSKNTPAS
jgi:hypothetical protein